MYRIEKLQREKGFDYSTVISRPASEALYPECFKTLISKVDGHIQNVTKANWESEDKKNVGLKKLTIVKDRRDEILDILKKTLGDDQVMEDEVIPRVEEINDELDESLSSPAPPTTSEGQD